MRLPYETKPAAWGAVGGAAVLAVVGFTWGGWVTGGTAETLANRQADRAVVAALTPICVEKFQQDAEAASNLEALQKVSSWQQGGFIEKGGWAKMAGTERVNPDVARACAEILRKVPA